MKTFFNFLFLLLVVVGVASALIQVDRIDIATNATGNISELSDPINGELVAIKYVNGNFTGNGTVYLNSTLPYDYPLDSYNFSQGNYTSYNTTFQNYTIPITGRIAAHMFSQQNNTTASVYLMYR